MDVASTVTADEQGDRLFQRALLELVEGVRLCRPDELAGLANEAVARLGVSMTIYLVDHEQQALHPLSGRTRRAGRFGADRWHYGGAGIHVGGDCRGGT